MIPSIEHIELAIMQNPIFNFRQNLMVFRISDFSKVVNHECDCLVLSKSGYLTEIEIKRSYSDFLADFKKKHLHDDIRIKDFFFMVHESFYDKVLQKLVEIKHIPSGIYTYDDECRIKLRVNLTDIHNMLSTWKADGVTRYYNGSSSRKLFLEEQFQLARLGAMRYKNMTERLIKKEDDK